MRIIDPPKALPWADMFFHRWCESVRMNSKVRKESENDRIAIAPPALPRWGREFDANSDFSPFSGHIDIGFHRIGRWCPPFFGCFFNQVHGIETA